MTVIGWVPGAAAADTVTLNVALDVVGLLEKEPLTPASKPLAVRETGLVKPSCGVTITVAWPLCPAATEKETGLTKRLDEELKVKTFEASG